MSTFSKKRYFSKCSVGFLCPHNLNCSTRIDNDLALLLRSFVFSYLIIISRNVPCDRIVSGSISHRDECIKWLSARPLKLQFMTWWPPWQYICVSRKSHSHTYLKLKTSTIKKKKKHFRQENTVIPANINIFYHSGVLQITTEVMQICHNSYKCVFERSTHVGAAIGILE